MNRAGSADRAASAEPAVLAIIPARAASVRLPGKNRRTIGGMSLVDRAVAVATGSQWITTTVISTDDPELLGRPYPAEVQALPRPAALASDSATTNDVIAEVLASAGPVDVVVLLQPTSPLRSVDDVDACIGQFLEDPDEHPVVSVVALDHPTEWSFELHDGALRSDRPWADLPARSQDCVPRYRVNGAVYVASARRITEGGSFLHEGTRAVVMPRERSIDIDTEDDLALAEWIEGRSSSTVQAT